MTVRRPFCKIFKYGSTHNPYAISARRAAVLPKTEFSRILPLMCRLPKARLEVIEWQKLLGFAGTASASPFVVQRVFDRYPLNRLAETLRFPVNLGQLTEATKFR